MSDNYIKVTVTGNKSKSVSVKSTELKNQITAGADMSIYYSNKAKEWAISDKLVDNEDYSSKYHADLAKSYTEEGALQIAEITTLREQTLADIETEKQNVIDIGTEQINQVSTISNTAISDIETSKTNALSDIDSAKTIVLEDISTQETQTINNIKETADVELDKIVGTGIDSRANIDLSNLSEVGEKHFLGKSQITNCLLEIPQRVKADVVDGTLTVYAGSVAIVPYGTEDLTAQYPVGSTFIHENFKVVDTQFADGKFFVWAEVQNDISAYRESTDTYTRMLYINVSANTLQGAVNNGSGTTPTANTYYYNTQTNFADYYEENATPLGSVVSLSLGLIKANGTIVFSTINQIFNGMGYIGSTIWLDKGVKGLIPNGRNEDGTLKNVEYSHNEIRIFTMDIGFKDRTSQLIVLDGTDRVVYPVGHSYNIVSDGNYPTEIRSAVFDKKLNKFLYNGGDGVYKDKNWITIGYIDTNSTAGITAFSTKQPFRAVDYSEYTNDIDGKWTVVNKTIFSSKTINVGATLTYNCKDILPKDGNLYECIFRSYYSIGGKVAGATIKGLTWGSFGKTLWWQDASTIAILQSNGTYTFTNMSSSEVNITGCSLILNAYRKVR